MGNPEENSGTRDKKNSISSRQNSTGQPSAKSQDQLLHELDIHKEKRAQKFLLLILVSHFTCVLPINVLKIVRNSIGETQENDTELDLAYVVLVFVTFLPSLILPAFYSRWILIGSICKELFRITSAREQSNRKNDPDDIFNSPTMRRNSEVENFREEVE